MGDVDCGDVGGGEYFALGGGRGGMLFFLVPRMRMRGGDCFLGCGEGILG